ncbi:primase-helicase family protein [Methylobacterium symbioticum]|uniref:NrS-1 polymerase-like helicase domain-containing protein n=1 Tax=Methylobacterium symbioticum TaxID=2584084 RepID=A0A509ECF5_9HYPH|nr:primase-helicase family protein [Methylobacterium symbioticum]VUD71840.1 hypothetical protein MET9862_02428 [Methylobacterium symbioticum]
MTAVVDLHKARRKAKRTEVELDAGGYSHELMNGEFAFLLVGSKAVVIRENPEAPTEQRVRFLTLDAFRQWSLNRFTEMRDPDGEVKTVTWAKRWLGSLDRRQYDGVEFHPDSNPDPAEAGGTSGYFNLWRGWSCYPKRGGSYSVFRDHLLTNVCGGDEALFRWVFAFFAHMVQRPRERLGVALVFRGGQGSGKTKIGEVFGSLIPDHYFLVDSARYLTGTFNAHMASCLLLQADEAVWGGDKQAEGRLKGLITSAEQMIESKGIDPIRLRNYVRVIMTSNEDWVVPAGKDERRYCVLDVGQGVAQNTSYFAELDEQLDAGGREALLADLLAFDLSSVDLRHIPRTAALLEQKILSLDPVDAWWLDRLMAGAPTRKYAEWPEELWVDLIRDDYFDASERRGIKRKSAETVLGARLRKLVPRLLRVRRYWETPDGQKRVWCYALPPLKECRAAFEKAVGQPIAWDDEDDTPAEEDLSA